jgi:hypothetical protein
VGAGEIVWASASSGYDVTSATLILWHNPVVAGATDAGNMHMWLGTQFPSFSRVFGIPAIGFPSQLMSL